MRPGRSFGGLFWGAVLVILGIVLLLNVALHISIPIFQVLFALLFVYLGLRILFGHHHHHDHESGHRSDWFSDRRIDSIQPGDRHDIVFGRGDIDLTHVALQDKTVDVEVNTVFGGCTVAIDAQMPVKVRASSAFGAVHLPDGNATAFGEYTWRSPALDESKPYLMLHVSSAFGGVRIVRH